VYILPAAKVLRGGSILNYGIWLRADANDYDDWGNPVHDERWSYKGIKKWLDKVEQHFELASISSDPGRKYPLRDAMETAWTALNVQRADKMSSSMIGLAELKEIARDGFC
jgi:choline dehydrogenase-like flavoprotein